MRPKDDLFADLAAVSHATEQVGNDVFLSRDDVSQDRIEAI